MCQFNFLSTYFFLIMKYLICYKTHFALSQGLFRIDDQTMPFLPVEVWLLTPGLFSKSTFSSTVDLTNFSCPGVFPSPKFVASILPSSEVNFQTRWIFRNIRGVRKAFLTGKRILTASPTVAWGLRPLLVRGPKTAFKG